MSAGSENRLAVAAAGATIIAAVIALLTYLNLAPTPKPTPTTATATTSVQPSRLPGDPTVQLSTPTAESAPSQTVSIRHSGDLTITDTSGFPDLDAPASDPQWKSGGGDIAVYNGLLYGSNASFLRLQGKQADYNTCRNATGYSTDSIGLSSMQVGEYLCWRTDEGRLSALRVLEIGENRITLAVTTYDPPTPT